MNTQFIVKNTGQLNEVALSIIPLFKTQPVVAFYGGMGAGKTTFIRHICKQLKVLSDVNSPTFSIVNQYVAESGDAVFHFDFYRIKEIEEAYDFGCEEYFESGSVCLIEWPQLIEDLLPENTLRIFIEVLDNEVRNIILK